MSDRPIQVGDLVIIVGQISCGHARPGTIFRVSAILAGSCECETCGKIELRQDLAMNSVTQGYPRRLLKRIPPLSELEGQRTEEKLKEPA